MRKSWHLDLPAKSAIFALLAGVVILLSSVSARADLPKGQLNHDVTVGADHNIQLKTGQAVQILKQSPTTDVIMVQLPDGSNGVYQVDAANVGVVASTPPPAPAATAAPAPIVTPPPAPAPPQPAPSATPPADTSSSSSGSFHIPPPPLPPPVKAPPPGANGLPTYPDGFVGIPELNTTSGKQSAGTASVVKLKDGTQSYLISARHLLGPDGGFAKQTAAKDVPAFVQSISLAGLTGGSQHYDVAGLLVPSQRPEATGGDPIDDLAIYQNHDSTPQKQALVLADKLPAVGETVWVVAHVRGGVPLGELLHSAKVVENDKWLEFQFDNDNIVPAGASGAPVLNAAGEVIGVYSGHSNDDGHVQGFAVPSPLIIKTIKEAPAPAQ